MKHDTNELQDKVCQYQTNCLPGQSMGAWYVGASSLIGDLFAAVEERDEEIKQLDAHLEKALQDQIDQAQRDGDYIQLLEEQLSRRTGKLPPQDAPDWEGFGRAVMRLWPEVSLDAPEIELIAERHRVLRAEDYDPETHGREVADEWGVDPGDSIYVRNYEEEDGE